VRAGPDGVDFLRALACEQVAVLSICLAKLLLGLAPSCGLVFLLEREQKGAGFYRGAARYTQARKLSWLGEAIRRYSPSA